MPPCDSRSATLFIPIVLATAARERLACLPGCHYWTEQRFRSSLTMRIVDCDCSARLAVTCRSCGNTNCSLNVSRWDCPAKPVMVNAVLLPWGQSGGRRVFK